MKKNAFKPAVSLLRSARWQLGGSIFVMVGLGVASVFTYRQAIPSDGESTRQIRAIQGHVNEISYNLATYVQNHDSFILDLIKEEGKQITQDLAQLTETLKHGKKADDAQRLEKAHNGLRETSIALLMADQELLAATNAQESARLDMEREAKLLTSRRGKRTDPSRLSITKFLKLSQDSQAAQTKKLDTINRYNEWREVFEKALRETSALMNEPSQEPTPLLFEGALVLLGLCGAIFAYYRARRGMADPIRDILQCVEAASSGDLTRSPDHWSADEIGQLSQAVGRLIEVLSRSENLVYHLAALVESSGDAIISHTMEGRILSWNKGAQRLYGYTAEEMKGQSIDKLAEEASREEFKSMLVRLQEGQKMRPFEMVHVARSGRSVRALVRVAAIHDSTRQIIGASFIAQEIPAMPRAAVPVADSQAA